MRCRVIIIQQRNSSSDSIKMFMLLSGILFAILSLCKSNVKSNNRPTLTAAFVLLRAQRRKVTCNKTFSYFYASIISAAFQRASLIIPHFPLICINFMKSTKPSLSREIKSFQFLSIRNAQQ